MMNIAIDIDDTLTDSFDYFLPYVAEYFGADVRTLQAQGISYSNLPAAWKADELGFCKAYYDRIVPQTPFKPDAAWGVTQLRELGHKVIILTGRTTDFYTDPYETTRVELEKGGIPYDKLICTLDKAEACARENVCVLIDDLPQNCASAQAIGVTALLFSSRANLGAETTCPRVETWAQVVDAISQMT